MDLSIPIIGLLGYLGYKFNSDGKTPRETSDVRKCISPHESPSNKNVYYSTYSKEIDSKEKQLLNKRMELSKDPSKSNIVSPQYDFHELNNKQSNSRIIPDSTEKYTNTQLNSNIIHNGPMFKNKLKHGSVKNNKSGVNLDNNVIYSNNSEFMSPLTGKPMVMKHNNMVPHFGSRVRQNLKSDASTQQIERFTGLSDVNYNNKQTVGAFFSPIMQDVYGTPIYTPDKERYNTSMFNNGIQPIPQIKVAPIDPALVLPEYKGIDEMRVKGKEQRSYTDAVVAGQNPSQQVRGILGSISKNRPEKYWHSNPSDGFVSPNGKIKPTSKMNMTTSPLNKISYGEYTPNIGGAYSSVQSTKVPYLKEGKTNGVTGLYTQVRNDHRQTFEYDGVRNAGFDVNQVDQHDRANITYYEQQRDTTSRIVIGPATSIVGGMYPELLDELRTTNKEGNLYSYIGNAKSNVSSMNEYSKPDFFSNREQIDDTKGYIPSGLKTNIHVNDINIRTVDDNTAGPYLNVQKGVNMPVNSLGLNELRDSKTISEIDQKGRIDPIFVEQFNKNPYTQSLSSF